MIGWAGELAGFATALLWAFGALAFAAAGRRIGAMAVNLVRIPIAVVLLGVLHWILLGSPWPQPPADALALLAASGVVGLSLGDLFYFHALAVLGPRLGALLLATWPVACAGLAVPILGETLRLVHWLGIAATVAGVVLVLTGPASGSAWAPQHGARARRIAVAGGLLGAGCQALGLIWSKQGIQAGGEGLIDPLSATLVRMVAGMLGVLLIALATNQLGLVQRLRDRKAIAQAALGSLFGPTLGVWLSLVAVMLTDAGIAGACMGTMPIFMLPIARVAYGSRPSARAIAGTCVAVAGGALLVVG